MNIPTSDSSSSVGGLGLTERRDNLDEGDKVVSREWTMEEDPKALQAAASCPSMYCLQVLHFGLCLPEGV
jgi:hypothetical protein